MSRSSCRATRTRFVAAREMWPFRVVPGDPAEPGRWQEEIDGCDAVVNLAGHNIFADRWNSAVKRKLRDSRVHSAEQLSLAIKQAQKRPGDVCAGIGCRLLRCAG